MSGSSLKKRKLEWLPPSVFEITAPFQFRSSTFLSAVPPAVLSCEEPIVLGVDEAGRGPVLGPMVYGIAYCAESYSALLQTKYGFADSKTLKDDKRQELFKAIVEGEMGNKLEKDDSSLMHNLGWATRTMTAKDILAGMLRSALGEGAYNLNEQAHDTTIQLIKDIIAQGVNVKKIFVDTVGPPVTYQAKLRSYFPNIEVTVAKKADSVYPIVSVASVVAKVTRDLNLKFFNNNIPQLQGQALGSGYPSDPITSLWLNSNVDRVFGWCFGLIRFLWQTAKDSLASHGAANVIYEEQCAPKEKGYRDVSATMEAAEQNLVDIRHYGSSSVIL